MSQILIHGIDSFLGSYFAARYLLGTVDSILYLTDQTSMLSACQTTDLVIHAACRVVSAEMGARARQEIADRLQPDGGGPSACLINEVWWFASSTAGRRRAEALRNLISACPGIGARKFNYVRYDDWGGDANPAEGITDHEVAELCRLRQIPHQIFRVSHVVADWHPNLEQSNSSVVRFLTVLHSLKTEIEERSQQYFDFQALRCLAPANATINLIPASVASDLLLRIGGKASTGGSNFSIVSPHNIPLPAFYENIGIAYDLGLLAATHFADLNAIDRAFHERLTEARCRLTSAEGEPSLEAFEAAGLSPDAAALDEDTQIEMFKSLRGIQDNAQVVRQERVVALPQKLTVRTLLRNGSELKYFVGGTADTTVVILNALGQGLEYWYRLLDRLMEDYRVIIWEPRGTLSPAPPFGLAEQVEDLDAVLKREGIEHCHLVGWCTGQKVAVHFHLQRPSAALSMVFLNSTFKCDASPSEIDTPYEKNLESLCRMLVHKPSLAASVMKTFQSRIEPEQAIVLNSRDGEQTSIAVLSMMNAGLKPYVLAPFRSEQTTLNYAHQMLDFWAHDSQASAHKIRIPVLIMGVELDQVVPPEASRIAAEHFPNARYVYVRGATHYCLYDRPDFVAGLLRTFFENPDTLPVPEPTDHALAEVQ